jgi:hypothetical protein
MCNRPNAPLCDLPSIDQSASGAAHIQITLDRIVESQLLRYVSFDVSFSVDHFIVPYEQMNITMELVGLTFLICEDHERKSIW